MAAHAGARPVVTLNGKALADNVEPLVHELVVESDSDAPNACSVVFADPSRTLAKDLGVDLAVDISVSAAPTGSTQTEPLFDGIVYGIEFELDEHGAFLLLTAYDRSYALRLGRQTRNFNDVTDADAVRQIAKEANLKPGTIDATPVRHKHLAQINETNWDFLDRRARQLDFEVSVEKDRLHFVKSKKSQGGPAPGDHSNVRRTQLVPGNNVEHIRVRVTAAQQVGQVQVRGWDPTAKRAVVSSKTASTRSVTRDTSPAGVAQKVGSPKWLRCAPSLSTQAECDALADAEVERHGAVFNFAEGTANGDPVLMAGAVISLGQTGAFDGTYVISSARHVFDINGYRTHFRICGPHDRSLFGLVSASARNDSAHAGLLPAVVTNLKDPDSRGRVKIKLPWLSDDYESDWARGLTCRRRGQTWTRLVPGGGRRGAGGVPRGRRNGAGGDRWLVQRQRQGAIQLAHQLVERPGRCSRTSHEEGSRCALGRRRRKGVDRDHDCRREDPHPSRPGQQEAADRGGSGHRDHRQGGPQPYRRRGLGDQRKGKGTFSADGGLTLKSSATVELSGTQIKLN